MALIISNAARLKPEIRLANAVSQFEASLSAEDKAAFRDQRLQALKISPDTMDVMRFTAQIDRVLSGKTARCLGPRFTNFLSTVQQFAALGDVIVGGSQNIVACGVWSVVRMSILAMTKHSTYLEDMSMIFMDVGRSSPRYQELALLYSQSQSLQASIHEYFIIIVRFCDDILKFTRKSAFAQFASSLNSETTKKTKSELLQWAGEIESETSVLLAKRIEDEATENSRFRLMSNRLSKSISEQQVLARKLRILDECSRYDHETTWKQIRKTGNTSLFTQDSKYRDWKLATESRTLLLFGKLGCGKSVAMANMVDDLTIPVDHHHTPVIYFFVRQDLPKSLKARTVIGSLARQLLRLKENFPAVLRAEGQKFDANYAVEDLIDLLRQTYTSKDKVYLVLDGLNLCEDFDKVEIINFLRRLQRDRRIDFVEAELARCLSNQVLILRNPTLILRIQDELLLGSRGMFLWVALQIRNLCEMATDNDIIEALDDLPKDLEATYRRILEKAQGKQKTYQGQILRFMIAAQQPLTQYELREALSVTTGDIDWTTANIISNIESVLTSCGCVIHVDEEEKTVRFVHPSVQDYLLRFPDALDIRGVWCDIGITPLNVCHRMMADVIVTYLSYGALDTQISTERVPHIHGADAPAKIIESVTARSKSAQRLALKFLAQRKRPEFNLGKALAEEAGYLNLRKREEFVFQHYAKAWCMHHIGTIDGERLGSHIKLLLPGLLERYTNHSGFVPEHALRLAVDSENEKLLDLLLQSPFKAFTDFRFETQHRFEPINYSLMARAVCLGNKRIVEKLQPTRQILRHVTLLTEGDYKLAFAPQEKGF
ncbi:hypothetical protein DE146DRAFT_741935 [Phaeosphaeria sp. MPI-PUGE-AT-0046c]|nr:hypothetical protein DE146DRAFT_741935 [Phaeosphaeria sp. MPI-PUGE-AT-0046c]